MAYDPVPDYHMHTPRCHHAIGNMREYAAAAVQLGLKEIGMSDHAPLPEELYDGWRMRRHELPDYLREAEALRAAFAGRLAVRIGLEADFYPGGEDYVRELIAAHDWDYIIGSVHYIGTWGFDNEDRLDEWRCRDVERAYCDYFDLVAASAHSGLFDIIGHPDLIKKFGHRPPLGSRAVSEAEANMLKAVKASGCTLEISSAGLRKPIAEVYPHARIIARAADLGIPFAFGSDAHAPGEVGHAMDTCLAMLDACGIRSVARYTKRQRTLVPIHRHDG